MYRHAAWRSEERGEREEVHVQRGEARRRGEDRSRFSLLNYSEKQSLREQGGEVRAGGWGLRGAGGGGEGANADLELIQKHFTLAL